MHNDGPYCPHQQIDPPEFNVQAASPRKHANERQRQEAKSALPPQIWIGFTLKPGIGLQDQPQPLNEVPRLPRQLYWMIYEIIVQEPCEKSDLSDGPVLGL